MNRDWASKLESRRGQPLQRHPDAPDRGHARGDRRRRGGRRAALRSTRPSTRSRSASPSCSATRPALFLPTGTMCNADRLPAAPRPGRRRGDPRHATSHPMQSEAGGPAALSGAMMQPARRRRRHLHAPSSSRRRSGRRATATRRARGSCPSSRPPTSAAAACGRSRRSASVLGVARRARPARAPGRRAADERGGRLAACRRPTQAPASTRPGSTSPRASARRSAPCSWARAS